MRTFRGFLVVSWLVWVGACGGSDGPGEDVADAGDEADAGRAPDAGETLDAGHEADAGGGHDAGPSTPGAVAWSDELENPYVLTIDSEIALDYFLEYTVSLPDPNVPAAYRRVTICQQPAGTTTPTCVSDLEPATEGTFGIRWGLDPTSYAEGENRYTFTVALVQAEIVVAEAVLEWMITYAPM